MQSINVPDLNTQAAFTPSGPGVTASPQSGQSNGFASLFALLSAQIGGMPQPSKGATIVHSGINPSVTFNNASSTSITGLMGLSLPVPAPIDNPQISSNPQAVVMPHRHHAIDPANRIGVANPFTGIDNIHLAVLLNQLSTQSPVQPGGNVTVGTQAATNPVDGGEFRLLTLTNNAVDPAQALLKQAVDNGINGVDPAQALLKQAVDKGMNPMQALLKQALDNGMDPAQALLKQAVDNGVSGADPAQALLKAAQANQGKGNATPSPDVPDSLFANLLAGKSLKGFATQGDGAGAGSDAARANQSTKDANGPLDEIMRAAGMKQNKETSSNSLLEALTRSSVKDGNEAKDSKQVEDIMNTMSKVDGNAVGMSMKDFHMANEALPAPLHTAPDSITEVGVSKMINVNDTLMSITKKSDTSIEVRIEPDGIGKLNIDINMEKGVVHAHISATEPQGKALLEKNLPDIINALAKEGLSVGGFSVSLKDKRGDFNNNKDNKGNGGNGSARNADKDEPSVKSVRNYRGAGEINIFA
ncbi:MAG: flagellar hook-length control protein FliK [Nitrospirae bacterium]|nr:flagellar hook-length control protein FliK [Nitrospirota bacterium]